MLNSSKDLDGSRAAGRGEQRGECGRKGKQKSSVHGNSIFTVLHTNIEHWPGELTMSFTKHWGTKHWVLDYVLYKTLTGIWRKRGLTLAKSWTSGGWRAHCCHRSEKCLKGAARPSCTWWAVLHILQHTLYEAWIPVQIPTLPQLSAVMVSILSGDSSEILVLRAT